MMTLEDTTVSTTVNFSGSGSTPVCDVGTGVHTPAVPGSYGSFVFTPEVNDLNLWAGSVGKFNFGNTADLGDGTC